MLRCVCVCVWFFVVVVCLFVCFLMCVGSQFKPYHDSDSSENITYKLFEISEQLSKLANFV